MRCPLPLGGSPSEWICRYSAFSFTGGTFILAGKEELEFSVIKQKQHQDSRSKPQIVGFICNWAAYSGAEMAGVEKRGYPANIRLVRLMCLGRLHLGLVLQAFELGADGVMLLGCPRAECHYDSGMEKAKELFTQARKVLGLLGADPKRLALVEVPVGRGDIFARQVSNFVRSISQGCSELGLRKD